MAGDHEICGILFEVMLTTAVQLGYSYCVRVDKLDFVSAILFRNAVMVDRIGMEGEDSSISHV